MRHPKKYWWVAYSLRNEYYRTNGHGLPSLNRSFKSIQESVPGHVVVLKRAGVFLVGQMPWWGLEGSEEEFVQRAHKFKDPSAAEMCARML